MLAARDQENLVHAHQSAAAGKPLNQAVRSLQPKTPGNNLKTPFHPSKNDENKIQPLKGGKPALDKNAFVTPVGPRNRAPLLAKTTNAKAQPFKTPAPKQQNLQHLKSARPSSGRRSLKSKITVASSELVELDILAQDDEDLPEPEYAPPNPVSLPDPPIDIPYNQDYPQFQGMNLMRGYGEVYGSPTDENGLSVRLKKQDELKEQLDREMDQKILDTLKDWPDPQDNDRKVDAMIAAGPKSKRIMTSNASTIRAKAAASVLSKPTYSGPSVSTSSTANIIHKTRKPAFTVLGAKKAPEPTNPSPMRSTAAAVVSKNTIGFPKAKKAASIIPANERSLPRALPATMPSKVDSSKIHPKEFVRLYGSPPVESEMWFRLKEYEVIKEGLKEEERDQLAENLFGTDFLANAEDDDEDIFQLPMP